MVKNRASLVKTNTQRPCSQKNRKRTKMSFLTEHFLKNKSEAAPEACEGKRFLPMVPLSSCLPTDHRRSTQSRFCSSPPHSVPDPHSQEPKSRLGVLMRAQKEVRAIFEIRFEMKFLLFKKKSERKI